jgi:XTP/dITP diphosphohydrolase
LILYLASTNPAKLREFRAAAQLRGISVEVLPGMENLPVCAEDGLTFEENARKKALHYSQFTNGLVFADDSGLCVDALAGAPGVYSARFAGEGATDEENNAKLLRALNGAPNAARQEHRAAHYVCVIALAQRNRILTMVEGRADGVILDAPRGEGGFGYDPLFFFLSLGKSYAELTPQAKFDVSHRGKAFRALLQYLVAA